jgi:hypothetical protein
MPRRSRTFSLCAKVDLAPSVVLMRSITPRDFHQW